MMGSRPQDYRRKIEQDEGHTYLSFASKAKEPQSIAADPQTLDRDGDDESGDETSEFGAMAQKIGAHAYHDKRVQMVGYMKSEDVQQWAGLWMRVDGPNAEGCIVLIIWKTRTIKGSSDWTRYRNCVTRVYG